MKKTIYLFTLMAVEVVVAGSAVMACVPVLWLAAFAVTHIVDAAGDEWSQLLGELASKPVWPVFAIGIVGAVFLLWGIALRRKLQLELEKKEARSS